MGRVKWRRNRSIASLVGARQRGAVLQTFRVRYFFNAEERAERLKPGMLKEQTDNAWTKLTDAMKSGKASEAEKNVFQRALHRLAEET